MYTEHELESKDFFEISDEFLINALQDCAYREKLLFLSNYNFEKALTLSEDILELEIPENPEPETDALAPSAAKRPRTQSNAPGSFNF